MRKIFFFLFILSFSVAACDTESLENVSEEDIKQISENLIVCDEPYIRVGSECCLDENSNNICDSDETKEDLKNDTIIENSSKEENESEEESQEVKETQTKEELSSKNKVTITIEKGINEFEFGGEDYSLEVGDIGVDFLADVELNSESDNIIFPFEQNSFDNLNVYLTNIVYSQRPNYKSYAEVMITNFDYILNSSDVSCIDGEVDPEDRGRTYGVHEFKDRLDTKEDYCIDDLTAADYYCGSDNRVLEKEINCERECFDGACINKICEIYAGSSSSDLTKNTNFTAEDNVECGEIFQQEVIEGDLYSCSDEIRYREAIFDTDTGMIIKVESDTCEEEFQEELKVETYGENQEVEVTLDGKDYKLLLENVFNNGIEKISIDQNSKDFVEQFSKILIGDIYIQILETTPSTRPEFNGHTKLAIGNYDFTLHSNNSSKLCYENGGVSSKTSSVFSANQGETFEVKESYCSDSNTLKFYSCNSNDEFSEEDVSCEYGCEQGRCLSIVDVGCDKEELNSGLISLGENEEINISNSTLELQIVDEGSAAFVINGSQVITEMCKEKVVSLEDGDVTILVHDTITSSRPEVKGHIEFSYE